MKINKLAPWNWFKKEEEQEGKMLQVGGAEPSAQNHPLLQLHREIDRVFDEAFRGFAPSGLGIGHREARTLAAEWLKPTLDLSASDKDYTISVELAGVDPKDVKLELAGDTLRINGEKRQESEDKDKNYYRMERSYGSFQRVLSLPEDAEAEKIEASFKNGLMKIRIPRKEPSETGVKRIAVSTS